jgi:hypothetical protein
MKFIKRHTLTRSWPPRRRRSRQQRPVIRVPVPEGATEQEQLAACLQYIVDMNKGSRTNAKNETH